MLWIFPFCDLISHKATPILFWMPELIDDAAPKEGLTQIGFDGTKYELAFFR